MLLTDPEVESSLLISSDEGATYQKYRLNFYILSLLFHPEQEDWILAYSHEQKVRERPTLSNSSLKVLIHTSCLYRYEGKLSTKPDRKQHGGGQLCGVEASCSCREVDHSARSGV